MRPVLLILVAVASCATTSERVVVSIRNLACVDCGHELEERAGRQPGVRGAHFDARKIELALDLAPGSPTGPILAGIGKEPIDGRQIEAVVGPGLGAFAPFAPFEPGWDAKVLATHGEDVSSFDPTAGRVTLVDFSADWCGPCHELDAKIHALFRSRPEKLAYRRINIVEWDSPVAIHYLGGAAELPFLIVLDGGGHEVARIAGLKPEELMAAIDRAER